MAEFIVNSKVSMATKVSLFITKYGRELKMKADIKRKEKVERVTELVKNEEGIGGSRSSIEENTGGNQNLIFKERLARKLTEKYIGPYIIEEMVSANVVKLRLPVL